MSSSGAAAWAALMPEDIHAQLEDAMRRGYVAAFRILGSADAARDACQEAAARALSARDRYDDSQPFYPWFHRILKNHCVDRLRGRRRLVTSEMAVDRAVDPSAGVEHLALAVHSEIIELRHFQDASYEEMALILDCPVGTVMSRLYRARKALRKRLQGHPAFAGGDP